MKLDSLSLCLLMIVGVLGLCRQPAQAEASRTKLAQLSAGMTSADVLQAWGVPDDKIIRETRRQERWDYGKRQVLFENGSVVRWRSDDPRGIDAATSSVVRNKSFTGDAAKSKQTNIQADDRSHLLDSILMDLPKDGGSDSAAIAPNNTMTGKPNPPDALGEEEEP